MTMLTLTLLAGLVGISDPQPDPQQGWVVEVSGYSYHMQKEPEKSAGWIIEIRGFIRHGKSAEKLQESRIDERKLKASQVESQAQIETVDALYVDDLPAFFKSLTPQKP